MDSQKISGIDFNWSIGPKYVLVLSRSLTMNFTVKAKWIKLYNHSKQLNVIIFFLTTLFLLLLQLLTDFIVSHKSEDILFATYRFIKLQKDCEKLHL